MTMRWVHTWKVDEHTGETKAKARLVVKGFTDPDVTEIRSESPTLSRLSRQLILRKGDANTAFLSGVREEDRTRRVRRASTRCATNYRSHENKC